MSQLINVRHYGFIVGKYTYLWKKKALYRYNPKYNTTMLIKQQLHGGSLGYDIQKRFYLMKELKEMTQNLNIKEEVIF